MPWTPKDVSGHDKKAKSAKAKRQWSDVANGVLKRTGDEGLAVREANGVIKDRRGKAHRDAVKSGHRHPVSPSEFHRFGA